MSDETLKLAQAYAKAKGSAVLDYKANEDGTITIVLVSGPKVRLTPAEIQEAVDEKDTQVKIAAAQLEAANRVVEEKAKDKAEAGPAAKKAAAKKGTS